MAVTGIHWEQLRSDEVAALDRERTVVVLPLGAVEQHGSHMPVGTDTILCHAVATEAARAVGGAVVMPPPWYGFSAHHMRFAGSITLRPETLMALVEDIADSLAAQDFRKFLILNGHGGNGGILDVVAAKLGHRHYGRMRVAGVTYFQLAAEAIAKLRRSDHGGTGHAGEFETAMMLHVRRDLVAMARAASTYPDPGSRFLSTDLVNTSPVRTYHDFGDLSSHGTLGDPSLASEEAGRRFFEAATGDVAAFIEDFRGWPIPKG